MIGDTAHVSRSVGVVPMSKILKNTQKLIPLAEAGKLTRDDVRELEKTIGKLEVQRKAERRRKTR